MKKTVLAVMFSFAMSLAIWTWSSVSGQNSVSDLTLQNVEALSNGEITVVGCKPMHGATCYVFDGNNQLVDKQKNQYPG